MKKINHLIIGLGMMLSASNLTHAQQNVYTPRLEACACPIQIDSSFRTRCAYLIVPENRKKNNGKTIKLPFIVVESKNPNKKKDPLLFTGGGPGGSSLGWARGAAKSPVINDRDFIAFEQRGTRWAIPHLASNELSDAIKESYRRNLNKDSMVVVGVKRYKKALESKGIDLSGYNTDETVSDIHDLVAALKLDSVNLYGISYSGGLMLAVLKKDPSRIRSLILDSPLPNFVPIDEDEPANFAEALDVLFARIKANPAYNGKYDDLKAKFERYFTSLEGKTFSIPYLEKGTSDSVNIQYTRNELLEIILNVFYREAQAPQIITDLITGNHYAYIKRTLDGIFENHMGPSGMRISVYCADQTGYHSEKIGQQLYEAYPYLKGFRINDVYKELCDCWNVPPIKRETKQPFYSNKPILLADGEMDNACRPLYIDMIRHYMPNSQRLLFRNLSHGVGGEDMSRFMQSFLENPYRKIESNKKEIIAY